MVVDTKVQKVVIYKDFSGKTLLEEPKKQGKVRSDAIVDPYGNVTIMNCKIENGEVIVPPTPTESKTEESFERYYITIKVENGEETIISKEKKGKGRARSGYVEDLDTGNFIKYEGDNKFIKDISSSIIEQDFGVPLVSPNIDEEIQEEESFSYAETDLTPHLLSLKIIDLKKLIEEEPLDIEKIKSIIRIL
jgi:hypothetical protein